jgi:hypothetical protein
MEVGGVLYFYLDQNPPLRRRGVIWGGGEFRISVFAL